MSRSVRALSVILAITGGIGFLIFATELAKLGDGFAPHRPFVAFMCISGMVLFVPLAFFLYCCTLKRAGPLLVVVFATAAVLCIGVWYEFVGADSLQLTAEAFWELRRRADGLTCFTVAFPAGI